MKNLKYILMVAILLVNLVFAQPSLADRPEYTKNPDYKTLIQQLKTLQTAKKTQAQLEGSTVEEIDQKINELDTAKICF